MWFKITNDENKYSLFNSLLKKCACDSQGTVFGHWIILEDKCAGGNAIYLLRSVKKGLQEIKIISPPRDCKVIEQWKID